MTDRPTNQPKDRTTNQQTDKRVDGEVILSKILKIYIIFIIFSEVKRGAVNLSKNLSPLSVFNHKPGQSGADVGVRKGADTGVRMGADTRRIKTCNIIGTMSIFTIGY